jgi:mannose-6-phosphate isomerase-like protein (cupin superfamily)
MPDSPPQLVIAAADILHSATVQGAIWSHTSQDLNINLLRFTAGDGIDLHVNSEVDVVGVVVEGMGQLLIGSDSQTVEPGHIFIIPQGVPRAIRALSPSFAYVSCHRRRAGLMPQFPAKQADPQP